VRRQEGREIVRIGHVNLDETTDAIQLRVADGSFGRVIRWVSLVTCAPVTVLLLLPFDRDTATLLSVLVAAMPAAAVASAAVEGERRAVAASMCPRVRRLVDLSRSRHAPDPGGIGSPAVSAIRIDDISANPVQFLGVVVATVAENSSSTVLVFEDRLFELASFPGEDEARAKELAERLASAVAGHSVKPPRIGCALRSYTPAQYNVGMLAGAIGVCIPLLVLHGYRYVAAAVSLVGLIASIRLTKALARVTARERSIAATDLLTKAVAALGLPRRMEPFR
jgi:hypothetical protein